MASKKNIAVSVLVTVLSYITLGISLGNENESWRFAKTLFDRQEIWTFKRASIEFQLSKDDKLRLMEWRKAMKYSSADSVGVYLVVEITPRQTTGRIFNFVTSSQKKVLIVPSGSEWIGCFSSPWRDNKNELKNSLSFETEKYIRDNRFKPSGGTVSLIDQDWGLIRLKKPSSQKVELPPEWIDSDTHGDLPEGTTGPDDDVCLHYTIKQPNEFVEDLRRVAEIIFKFDDKQAVSKLNELKELHPFVLEIVTKFRILAEGKEFPELPDYLGKKGFAATKNDEKVKTPIPTKKPKEVIFDPESYKGKEGNPF